MIDETGREGITSEDLDLVSDPDDDTADTSDDGAEDIKTAGTADVKTDGAKAEPDVKGKTIATGADAATEDAAKEEKVAKEHKPYWPDDWREKLAEHMSAGDKKAYNKELNRLKRITDPSGVYGLYREMESKLTGGGLIKMPGKNASEDEVKAFRQALGWTEKPEEMLDKLALADGVVLGDDDKPILNEFIASVHGATSAAEFASKATNWYFARQEAAAAAMDDADDEFRREAEAAIKDEWGPAFKRRSNAIGTVFATAPGGADVKNENSLFSRLMGGRTADGKLIGNDPDMLRWLDSIRSEINPAASVVEDGNQTGLSIDNELQQIKNMRRTDPRRYWSGTVQTREQELLAAQLKIQERERS